MSPKTARALYGILGQIAGLLNGTVATALKMITNLFLGGFQMAIKFNDTAMAFSRQAGITAKQAQAYTEVLATRAKDLGAKYGIAAEEVAKLDQNLTRASGRVLMLGQAEAERQIQINRTVGEDTSNQFAQTIMRTMGGQLSTVQGAVSKAYATAAKKGLDAAGMAAKVGQNLSMANRLTFKNGIDGLTKMVALSEKFGFNMQTLESAANSFMTIQDAIESSAKLSMLGGAAGAFGGNPLDMSYEANYDPEAFGERMTKMLGGYAKFDEKTGMSTMNALSRDFVKGIADAMHISLDEASSIAKKQAEITYKNNKFGTTLDNFSRDENGRIDENKRDFLLNKSQIENGVMKMFSSKTGKMEEMSYFESGEGADELADMMKYNNMSDAEIMAEQSQTLLSIHELIQGFMTSINGTMAKEITPFIPQIKTFLGDIYKMILPHVGKIAENIKGVLAWVLSHGPEIKKGLDLVITAVGKVATFITKHWALLIGAAFLTPILGGFASVVAAIIGSNIKNNAANPAKKGTKKNRTWKQAKNDAKLSMRNKKGLSKGISGAKTLFRNSRGVRNTVRGIAGIGTILTALEVGSTIMDYSSKKSAVEEDKKKSEAQKKAEVEKLQKGRNNDLASTGGAVAGGSLGAWIGGAIGTALAPGIGTAIGAAAGGALAGWLGSKGARAASESIQGSKESLSTAEPHALGGYVGGRDYSGDKIVTKLNSGEAVVPVNNQWDFMSSVKDLKGAIGMTNYTATNNGVVPDNRRGLTSVVAKPVGGKEYIYTPSNSQTNNTNSEVKVNDFNVNISGTIRLDGGNNSQNIDVRSLLNDVSFVSALKDIIKESMASDINGGRVMHDVSYLRGMPSQSTTLGRMPA